MFEARLTISRSGMWPFPWQWKVTIFEDGDYRDTIIGSARTRDRAEHKAQYAMDTLILTKSKGVAVNV